MTAGSASWRRGGARALLAAHALMLLAGCGRWVPQPLVPQAVIEEDHPDRLRVTRIDSSRVELRQPRVESDSLKGMAGHETRSIPLAEVAYVSLHRQNDLPVILALSLGLAVGLTVALAASYD